MEEQVIWIERIDGSLMNAGDTEIQVIHSIQGYTGYYTEYRDTGIQGYRDTGDTLNTGIHWILH